MKIIFENDFLLKIRLELNEEINLQEFVSRGFVHQIIHHDYKRSTRWDYIVFSKRPLSTIESEYILWYTNIDDVYCLEKEIKLFSESGEYDIKIHFETESCEILHHGLPYRVISFEEFDEVLNKNNEAVYYYKDDLKLLYKPITYTIMFDTMHVSVRRQE